MTGPGPPCRLFLSSPSDVEAERDAVRRVVERINAEHPGQPMMELIRWEDAFYTADSTFQAQIPRASDCQLVVCIFWKRLGSSLPDSYRRPDGSLPTGTEFEFEDALNRATETPGKVPDVLVYRNLTEVTFSESNLEFERAQRDRFLAFWNRWFRNEQGHFVAGFQSYSATSQFERLFETHLRQWLARQQGGPVWTHGSPFRGLAAFDLGDAPVFFGRRRETERLRARFMANALGGARILILSGASGTGKSSLARAGLLARLTAPGGMGEMAGFVRHVTLTPAALTAEGQEWSGALATLLFADEAIGPGLVLGDFDTPAGLAALLAAGGAGVQAPLVRALARMKEADPELARSAGAADGALIVLIDQLEELFHWPADRAAAFLTCLEALTTGPAPIHVIATLRSDFRDRLGTLPALHRMAALDLPLAPGAHERVVDIARPGSADLAEMIAGPARAAGLTFESSGPRDLQLILEAEAEPEALPALQLLLTELYARRDGNQLLLSAHDQLGGAAGVMATRGEEVLAAVDSATRAAFPALARLLVTATPGGPVVARPLPLAALDTASPEAKLATALRDASLLVSDRGVLRIAHESLIVGWQRLGSVIGDERRLLEIRDRLAAMCRNWSELPPGDKARRDRLLTGFSLAEARELRDRWGDATLKATAGDLPAFIAASDTRERSRRRGRVAAAVAVTALLTAAGTATAWFRADAGRAGTEAEARLHLARAEAMLRLKDTEAAFAHAAAALATQDTLETRSMALAALTEASPYLDQRIGGATVAVAWADPTAVALLDQRGHFRFGETSFATSASPLRDWEEPLTVWPDGRGGFLVLLPLGAMTHLPAGSTKVGHAAGTGYFLPLAHQADARATETGATVVQTNPFDGTTFRHCTFAPLHCDDVIAADLASPLAALSPDGRTAALVLGGAEGPQLVLVDTGNAAVRTRLTLDQEAVGGRDAMLSLGWSTDGKVLALGTRDLGLSLFLHSDGHLSPLEHIPTEAPVVTLAWSPVGSELAFVCDKTVLCRIGMQDDTIMPLPAFNGGTTVATHLAWAPDGKGLASVHSDGTTRIWRAAPTAPVILPLHPPGAAALSVLATDPARGLVAAGDAIGQLFLWQGDDVALALPALEGDNDGIHTYGELMSVLEGGTDNVRSLALAADGTLGVLRDDGRVTLHAAGSLDTIRSETAGEMAMRLIWLGDDLGVSQARNEILLIPLEGPTRTIQADDPGMSLDGLVLDGQGRLLTSVTSGAILRWTDGVPEVLISAATVDDTRAALSLSVDATGRWLAASRNDDQLVIYDLTSGQAADSLPLYGNGTRVVAFSPDGRQLAALGADSRLYLWDFSPESGTSTALAAAPAVPDSLRPADDDRRPANWMAWADESHIAVATSAGEVLLIATDPQAWRDRLAQFD